MTAFDIRIGEGWDVHAWCRAASWSSAVSTSRSSVGLLGHSDADVLLHAITDALLGAAGLGDIGRHFPDTDERFKRRRFDRAADRGGAARARAGLADRQRRQHRDRAGARSWRRTSTPCATRIAAGARTWRRTQVNVKAKTAEKLGPVGEGLAIEARAVVLLHR